MSDIVVETINNNIGIDSSEFKVGAMATTLAYGSGVTQVTETVHLFGS